MISSASDPIKLGLVGAGAWGRKYIPTVRNCAGVQLEAVHVRNPASASSLDGEEFLIFSNLEDMFSRAGLDGAIVASAAASHHRITAKALEMGLAVLVEKPFTLSPQSAFELRETAIAKKLVVQVNHVDLANPAWNAVCQQIPSISPLVSLTGAWLGDGPLRPDSPGRWDYGPHAIAVTIDAVGSEPQAVEAHRIKRRGAAEIVEVKMAWCNGVLATVRFGNAESEKQRQIFIRGTRGTLEYDDISETKARKNGEPLEYSAQSPLASAVLNFAQSIRVGDLSHESLDMGVAVVSTLARVDKAGGF